MWRSLAPRVVKLDVASETKGLSHLLQVFYLRGKATIQTRAEEILTLPLRARECHMTSPVEIAAERRASTEAL